MRRLLLTSLLTTALFTTATASSPLFDNPDNVPFWGLRAGADIAIPGDWKAGIGTMNMYDGKAGGFIGAIYQHPLAANLYVEPGVQLYYDTYRYDLVVMDDDDTSSPLSDPKVSKFGLRIPINFGFRFDVSDRLGIAPFTGPEFNWGFGGKIHLSGNYAHETISDTNPYSDIWGWHHCNLSWNFGVSFDIDYNWSFILSGAIGVTDQLKFDNITWRDNRFSISLGYNF
ncbi:MAG: hypothetical protein K2O24_05665 [Muribaculaceae bacterium]|nr:hypothetical protein [Muribaculaceae bacterium]